MNPKVMMPQLLCIKTKWAFYHTTKTSKRDIIMANYITVDNFATRQRIWVERMQTT